MQRPVDSERISLLQWNIDYRAPIEQVVHLVEELRPDIVCLQEITNGYMSGPDVGQYLSQKLSLSGYYDYGPMVLPDGTETQIGMGIWSRLPLIDSHKVILQPAITQDGAIVQDERFYLQASILLPGDRRVTVGTTHLPFHPRFRTTARKQAMVERILEESRAKDLYILAGDLNATPGSKAVKTLRQTLRNAGPALHQKSWTTKPFRLGPHSYDELRWRLDHVLYKGLASASGRLIEVDISDHKPLLVELRI